ncbi:hypothetical protein ACEYW6_03670 [Nostoc sp. UIC 10607]|uniref:hypothetical protein n=1 Tax=Nostoc sp. UIC 10607 TaxID=3045935 RepID=UPI0039A21222
MIPLILGAAALATGAFGALKGSEGIGNMNQAKEIGITVPKRENCTLRLKPILHKHFSDTYFL